jgi:hypothetical protein
MKTRLDSDANRVTSFQDKKITFLSLHDQFYRKNNPFDLFLGIVFLLRQMTSLPKNHNNRGGYYYDSH